MDEWNKKMVNVKKNETGLQRKEETAIHRGLLENPTFNLWEDLRCFLFNLGPYKLTEHLFKLLVSKE